MLNHQNKASMSTLRSFVQGVAAIAVILTYVGFSSVQAQDVRHPLSGVSTTAQFYSYIHPISPTAGIEIKYFIVESSTGDIKVAFDACEICWSHYKGYAQLNTFMRCLNCSNVFPIDDLGPQANSGCWPSYLPHTTDANDVIIQTSDLESGAHYFQQVVISGVGHHMLPAGYDFHSLPDHYQLEMPKRAKRKLGIVGLDGKQYFEVESSDQQLRIEKSNFSSGVYLLTIEEGNNYYYKRFLIE